ncbi:unnamed protein product, partial [Mesorhabditis belari]|uniref:Uncharacterized protein n=1 Tax=Mesorhabditis belari TaxID=2138241 RepID=A0AAF3EHF9_9BILA
MRKFPSISILLVFHLFLVQSIVSDCACSSSSGYWSAWLNVGACVP